MPFPPLNLPPGSLQLSREGAVVLTATGVFIVGTVIGMLSLYFILKYRKINSLSTKKDSDQPAVSPLPETVYEDVSSSPGDIKCAIELKDNVAYGPQVMELKQNLAYGPLSSKC